MKTRFIFSLISVSLILAACHSKKELTASTTEVCDIVANGSSLTATDERLQWMSNLALEIDSFEMFIPADHFAVNGKMVHDTVVMLLIVHCAVSDHAVSLLSKTRRVALNHVALAYGRMFRTQDNRT